MSEIYIGKPSAKLKAWCKEHYGKKSYNTITCNKAIANSINVTSDNAKKN